VSAYCGLTPVYTRLNFMDKFCEQHWLLLPHVEHEQVFGALDMATGDGASAYQLCAVWALRVLDSAHRRQQIAGDVLRIMAEDTLKARALLNSLFAYQYQVIPFVYSHLVSTGSFLYLLGLAVLKAAAFRPEETTFNGIIMPLSSFLIALVTMIGLIEIGSAIANPWGTDPEDFAVPLMLQVTAKCSRLICELEQTDPLSGSAVEKTSEAHTQCMHSLLYVHAIAHRFWHSPRTRRTISMQCPRRGVHCVCATGGHRLA